MASENRETTAAARLASPFHEIKEYYPVVVIGSGYGGAIAASRLARAGQKVCILERGREFQAGEFPDSEAEVLAETQAGLPAAHLGAHTALYDFRINRDVNVFVGSGLGGTSLINGNVALRPDPRIFDDARWPAPLREDAQGIEEGYRRAEEMLQPVPYPERYPALPKLLALEDSAAQLGRACTRPPIAVTFEEGINRAGIAQHPCILCGDCITGCNYGAKNTLAFNYLPDARHFGAEIYTQVSVRRIERQGARWLVYYRALETGFEDLDDQLKTVSAETIILAAGTLGSTEILLRSKAAGLPLSAEVGRRFSGNGDALGFSFNCDEEIRGVGYGRADVRDREAVGPCVAGMIDLRDESDLDQGIVIQDMVAPGALAGLLPQALAQTGAALGRASGEGLGEALAREAEIETLAIGPYATNPDHTQAYLVTTHERGAGTMRLEDGRLQIEWPQVGEQRIFQKVNATLAEATRALGGEYLINPMWSAVFNHDLITVHPLGGCVMASDAEHGVVNHKGQVFAGTSGTAVYDGLYVCDGAVIPRSLGVGPLLTIAALSERACALLARDHGWTIDYTTPAGSDAVIREGRQPMVARFVETARNADIDVDLSVVCPDLEALFSRPEYRALAAGQVSVPAASDEPLKVVSGELGGLGAGRGVYRISLAAVDGRKFSLEISRQGASLDLTLCEGEAPGGSVLVKSMAPVLPLDLQNQLTTIRVYGAPSAEDRLRSTVRLGRALAGDLYDVYGSVTENRKKRPLRANAPTVHTFTRGRLIRFEGGSRGPVLLVPGAGLESTVFTLDTIETNLVEFLFARSFDLWILDAAPPGAADAAMAAVKAATRAPHVSEFKAESAAATVVELNAATRDAVPEAWRGVSIIGANAAREVYPAIVKTLSQAPVQV